MEGSREGADPILGATGAAATGAGIAPTGAGVAGAGIATAGGGVVGAGMTTGAGTTGAASTTALTVAEQSTREPPPFADPLH